MDTPAGHPATPSAVSAPNPFADRARPASIDDWDDSLTREPAAMPEAWITLLFALLVTVFTVAAAWNWFRA